MSRRGNNNSSSDDDTNRWAAFSMLSISQSTIQ